MKQKITLKWIKSLNARPNNLKPLRENVGISLCSLRIGSFLDVTVKAQATQETIKKISSNSLLKSCVLQRTPPIE